MGKVLALSALGGGGAAVVVGGYCLTKGFGGASEEGGQQKSIGHQSSIVDTLENFKNGSENDKCIKALFKEPTIKLPSLTKDGETSIDNSSFFGIASTNPEAKGCLAIDYEKTKESEGASKGTFTWTWAFINKDKAFVNFNIATTKETNKLNLSGVFYLLSHEGQESSKTWRIKLQKETESKEVESSNLAIQFPKKKENSQVYISDKDYWDFVDEKGNLIAETATPKSHHWKWEWKEQKASENLVGIGEWSSNLKSWWENLYKGTGSEAQFDLEKNLESFKGTWSKVSE